MDKTIVERSKGPQILEWVVGIAAAAVILAICWVAVDLQLTAELVLWSSGGIVVAALGGLLFYVIAAITGAAARY